MFNKKAIGVASFLMLVIIPFAFAEDAYKPYLHEPIVPESPGVKLYGSYATNLFPGAATYSYDIEVPPGEGGDGDYYCFGSWC